MLCIDVEEIDWIEAAGNYVQIYCSRENAGDDARLSGRKSHLVRHTIKAMAGKLDPDRFVRVRPSAIVAVARVQALNARPGGDYVVVLGDGTEIRSSRGYRAQVERALTTAPGTGRRRVETRRRGAAESTLRDSGHDLARDSGRDLDRDSGRDLDRDSGRDLSRDSGRDLSRDSGRDLGRGDPAVGLAGADPSPLSVA